MNAQESFLYTFNLFYILTAFFPPHEDQGSFKYIKME